MTCRSLQGNSLGDEGNKPGGPTIATLGDSLRHACTSGGTLQSTRSSVSRYLLITLMPESLHACSSTLCSLSGSCCHEPKLQGEYDHEHTW